ncbi:nuclear transport factor 2 family protein [Maribacter confluentis]|uniref:Nuclear transport factor 2 family protein n=2 Tax=Maribacter confluentis TaxID=1656093 RepID=A0ABT8RM70_9FLAO|nr:nuclear transport factor 2 family protein [Maribacter confluentis]MDO1511678.1 nuclear transport factor 2 family protein [Maribacter confluentis]
MSLCLLLVSVACSSTNLMAQNNKNEIAKIESKVKEIYTAMVVKDKDVLEDLTLEKLSYGHSNGKIENKSEYVDGVLNGSFQFTSITPIDQTISIVDDVGIVRHVFNGEGINNGMPAKVNIGCLLIFQKGNGNWKLLARQAFKL